MEKLQSKDLRIGNKLQKENGEIFTVLRIDNTMDILVEEQRCLLTLNYNLYGIKLTEEWLFKFGFNRINEAYWCNGKLGIGYITNDEFFQYEYFSNKHKTEIIELKYVHQLQNIYFALTGIELTIK